LNISAHHNLSLRATSEVDSIYVGYTVVSEEMRSNINYTESK